MLIVFMLVLIGTAACLIIFSPIKKSAFLMGMYLSLVLLFSAMLLYLAKLSGFSGGKEQLFFLSPAIRDWLFNLAITLDAIGYIAEVGRLGFAYFLLMSSMRRCYSTANYLEEHPFLYIATALPIVGALILYLPRVHRSVFISNVTASDVLIKLSLVIIFSYVVVGLGLLLYEYFSTTLAWYRRKSLYLLLSNICLAVIHFVFGLQDPIYIYMTIPQYKVIPYYGYFYSYVGMEMWIAFTALTIAAVILGCIYTIKYVRVDYSEGRLELSFKEKVKSANRNTTIMIHGLKNQVLSSKILSQNITREIESGGDLTRALEDSKALTKLNTNMLNRMTALYRSMKENVLVLSPVTHEQLCSKIMTRFYEKCPDTKVTVNLTEGQLLADIEQLSEAICNLLVNGVEAARDVLEPQIILSLYTTRFYSVITVSDNGKGIDRRRADRIFDPFYTDKNTDYNWGMGLCFVRTTVKNHMGKVRLESKPGFGTKFFITLPTMHTHNLGGKTDEGGAKIGGQD